MKLDNLIESRDFIRWHSLPNNELWPQNFPSFPMGEPCYILMPPIMLIAELEAMHDAKLNLLIETLKELGTQHPDVLIWFE